MPAPPVVQQVTELVADDTDRLPRSEWQQLRHGGLGGSDAAAVAGLDPWRSPLHVYEEKRGTLPAAEQFEGNEKTEWGHRLEPVLAGTFAERTGLTVQDANVMLRHPRHGWMLANPDRWVVDPTARHGFALLEIKTCGERMAEEWDDGPPFRAAIQTNHYLAVAGLHRAYVAVLIGGQEFRWYRLERDETIIESLVQIEADFWERVQTGTPPPPGPSDKRLLTRRWEPEPGTERLVDEDQALEMIRIRQNCINNVNAAKAERDEIENHMRVMLGDADIAVAPTGRVLFTWKQQRTQPGFDRERFELEQPVAAAMRRRYETPQTTRVLRVPKKITNELQE